METKVEGDGQKEQKIQFEPCKNRREDEDSVPSKSGYDKKCKYMDNYGNCIFENCVYDQEEKPPHVTEWWFTCVACQQPDSIDPKHMKVHFCRSCIKRINEREVLPFTCRYCGKTQNHPSLWWASGVCDDCIPQLWNKNCKNYWCRGARHQV